MEIGSVILGGVGMVTYGAMTVLLYFAVRHMEKDPETAVTKFYLKKETQAAFKSIAMSMIIVGLPLLVEAFSRLYGLETLGKVARASIPFVMSGLLYAYLIIYKVTERTN
ncbi:MAG: hypothetical protein ABEJ93_01870 [Candidatus Nanohalobium sp.]